MAAAAPETARAAVEVAAEEAGATEAEAEAREAPRAEGVAMPAVAAGREAAAAEAMGSTRRCSSPAYSCRSLHYIRTCGTRRPRTQSRKWHRPARRPEGRGNSHRLGGAAHGDRLRRAVAAAATSMCLGTPSHFRHGRLRPLFGGTWQTFGPCASCRQTRCLRSTASGRTTQTPWRR